MTGEERYTTSIVGRILELQSREMDLLDRLLAARFGELVSARMSESVPLGTLCERLMVGKAYVSPAVLVEDGVTLLRGKNITPNQLNEMGISCVPPDFDDKSLLAGDILVRQTGQPGVACIVPPSYAESFVASALILRLRHDCEVDAEYVCRYINSAIGQQCLNIRSQHYLSKDILAAMPIVILKEEERAVLTRLAQTIETCKRRIGEIRGRLPCLGDEAIDADNDEIAKLFGCEG